MINYIRRFWKDHLVIVLILLVSGFCETFVSIQMANLLDALIAFDFNRLTTIFLLISLLFLTHFIFLRLRIIKISQVKQKMATAIRSNITHKIEKSEYNTFHQRTTSTYISWLTNDINTIETMGFDNFYALLSGAITTISSILALFYFHWSLVILAILAGMLTIYLPRLLEKPMAKAALATTEENERFMAIVTEKLAGYDTFFSYNLLAVIQEKTSQASDTLGEQKNKQAKVLASVTILSIFGSIFGQVSIVGLTTLLAFNKIVSIGAFSATGNLSISIFNLLGGVSHQLAQIKATDPIFEKFNSFENDESPTTKIAMDAFDDIELTNLSYSYDTRPILKSLDYCFSSEKKYAIVGSSGQGKSTLLHLLSGRLRDYSGSITISGVELHQIDGKSLRDHLVYIDQTPYISSGSLRDNITLGEPFSEEALNNALIEADLLEFINSLPNALDTFVEEAGRSLSGGQKQRISLARGLIRGKKIILVDEGTANLDKISAMTIEKNLMQRQNLTVILITHHLDKEIEAQLDGVLSLNKR